MIRVIRCTQTRELLCVGEPVEVTTVHDTTAYLRSQSVHIFRGGVGDDISTPLERMTVDGSGEGVVDDERYPILMGDTCKFLDVENSTTRIRDGLSKQQLGIGTEGSLYLFLTGILRNESTLDTEFLQGHTEEVIGTSVYLIGSHEMVASLTDIEHGVEVRCLSRGC